MSRVLKIFAAAACLVVGGAACSSGGEAPCSPQVCGGCCDATGKCRTGAVAEACGFAGASCTACGTGQSCVDFACQSTAAGGGAGGGSGGSGGGTAVGGGSGCTPEPDPTFCARVGAACGIITRPDNCGNQRTLNCGSCQAPLNATPACASNTCSFNCNAGFHVCSGQCSSNASPSSCGAACTPCPAGPPGSTVTCVAGACGFACPAGLRRCGNQCVADSPTSCGASCTACPQPPGSIATCTAGACGLTCSTGFHTCNGVCAPNTSINSCGTRCTPCATPANALPSCDGGACGFDCNAGFHACSGACSPNTDVQSCGSSCTPCPAVANAVRTCDGVACGFTCNAGFHACGGACVSNTAIATCGASCTACQPPANSVATCDGTTCGFTCSSGFNRCGSQCLPDSPTSCGASCATCPGGAGGMPVCTGGVCDVTCLAGFHKCGGVCVADDQLDHCGTLCTPCPDGIPGSTRSCTRSGPTAPYLCGSSCPAGTNSCPSAAPQRCAAPDDTLACGPTCSICNAGANRRGVCASNGICGSACITDCGGVCVDAQSNNANCGTCGTACGPGRQCTQGQCRDTCATGMAFLQLRQSVPGAASGNGSLAVADFDADGRQDVVYIDGNFVRFRRGDTVNGAASGTFGAVSASFNVFPTQLVVGDLTLDGRPEVVVLTNSSTVYVLRTIGAPTWFTQTSFIPSTGLTPNSGVIADLFGSTNNDLLLGFTTMVAGQSAMMFAGTTTAGHPLVSPGTPAGLGVTVLSLQLGQLTASPPLDVAVAAAASTLYLMPGTGVAATPFDSASAVPVMLPAGETLGAAFELADVTGDATPDLVVPVAGVMPGVRVFPITLGPVVGASIFLPTPAAVRGVVTVDVDGDGRRDVLVHSSDLRLFRNLPAGFDAPLAMLSDTTLGSGVRRMAGVNATEDPRPDLIMLAGAQVVLIPNVGGAFAALDGPVTSAVELAAGDVNGDGLSDAVISMIDGGARMYVRAGAGWTAGAAWPIALGSTLQVSELNQDAFGDVVTMVPTDGGGGLPDIRQVANGRVEVFMNGSWGTVCDDSFSLVDAQVACRHLGAGSALGFTTVGGGTGAIHLDDLGCSGTETSLFSCPRAGAHNCDHSEDVGVTCSTPGAGLSEALEVRFGSAGSPGAPVRLQPLGRVRTFDIADFDGDGRNDVLVVTDANGRSVELFRNLGGEAFAPPVQVARNETLSASPFLVIADINDDGRRDFGLATNASNQLRFWMNNGGGSFVRLPSVTAAVGSVRPFARDLNGDGKIDLITAAGVYTGDGIGNFTLVSTPAVPPDRRMLADFDNDGLLDLAGAGPTGVVIARGQPVSGLFGTPAEPLSSGAAMLDVAVARLDADDRRDFVAVSGTADGARLIAVTGVCR